MLSNKNNINDGINASNTTGGVFFLTLIIELVVAVVICFVSLSVSWLQWVSFLLFPFTSLLYFIQHGYPFQGGMILLILVLILPFYFSDKAGSEAAGTVSFGFLGTLILALIFAVEVFVVPSVFHVFGFDFSQQSWVIKMLTVIALGFMPILIAGKIIRNRV